MTWLGPPLIGLLVIGFLAGVFSHACIINALRRRHPETWKRLGSPTLVTNNSIHNTRRLRAYIKSGDYRDLDDPRLERTIRIGRLLEVGYLMVLLVFAALFVATLVRA